MCKYVCVLCSWHVLYVFIAALVVSVKGHVLWQDSSHLESVVRCALRLTYLFF